MNLRKEFNAALKATGSTADISKMSLSGSACRFTEALREGTSLASGRIA